ncbi:MAG: sulfatase-like hydrolase/transferase [Myxococcota bacterium]|nr:sulfatase-like hydrolase/transferase [Myxococcota bacterium]
MSPPRSPARVALRIALALSLIALGAAAVEWLRKEPRSAPWLFSLPLAADLPLLLDLSDPGEARRWYRGPAAESEVVPGTGLGLRGSGPGMHASRAVSLPAGSLGSIVIETAAPVAPIHIGVYIKGRTKPHYGVLAERDAGRPRRQTAFFGTGRWEERAIEGIRLTPAEGTERLVLEVVQIRGSRWPPASELDPHALDWRAAFGSAEGRIENALLIVVDTLRADHLSLYGYGRPTSPHLDLLARFGTVFEAARSQAACTFPSVNSLLTSRPPEEFLRRPAERFARLDAYEPIAKRLRDAGWRTFAVSASWVVRATESPHNDWGGGYAAGFGDFSEACAGQQASCVNHQALARIDAADGPWFGFLHYLDPHDPYDPPPSFERRFAGPYDGDEEFARGNPNPIFHALYRDGVPHGASASDVAHLTDLYDDEIRYFDAQLALLFAALHERGLLGRTAIVLASDHGEGFLDHGHMKHCRTVFDFETRTPLVWWVPGVPGGTRSTAVVQNLDIAPTLLDLLGVEPPTRSFAGQSLRPTLETGRAVNTFAFSEQSGLQSADDGRYKLIRDRRDGSESLFDLRRDPGEARDLASDLPEQRARLGGALDDWTRTTPAEALQRADDLEARLEALGYLE